MPRPGLHPAQECTQCQGCWICQVRTISMKTIWSSFGAINQLNCILRQFQGLPIDNQLYRADLLHSAQSQVNILSGSIFYNILAPNLHWLPSLTDLPKKIWILEKMKFQDDLFPPTRVLWRSSCSGARWLAGELGAALWVNKRRVTKIIFFRDFLDDHWMQYIMNT